VTDEAVRYPIEPMKKTVSTLSAAVLALAAGACALNPKNDGVPGSSDVKHPDVPGTIFTIVFENHSEDDVIKSDVPFFWQAAHEYGIASAYISSTHPSCPNYIELTSGSTNGVDSDNDPSSNVHIQGSENLADQLDAAGVKWRAYMESMAAPCGMSSHGSYAAKHDPFVYYASMQNDPARCADRIVDFGANFTDDLASDRYRYMWITPDLCNDMHDCDPKVGDAWLKNVVTQIQASPGYQRGGAIFILFDEGSVSMFGAGADLPTIVISPNLVSPGYVSQTRFDHASYVATVEDILGIPRLHATEGATPMDEFFKESAPAAIRSTGDVHRTVEHTGILVR
jgi:hypothetical protein